MVLIGNKLHTKTRRNQSYQETGVMRKGKIISIFFFNLFKLEIHLKYLHAMQQGDVALHVAFTGAARPKQYFKKSCNVLQNSSKLYLF